MSKSVLSQIHPIPPLYAENSHTLILGSFPSVLSRETGFFYGHPQNRFWKVIAELYGCKTPVTKQEKASLILENRLALWDVIASCEISGSSDSSIKNVIPNDIGALLEKTQITRIFVNGKTAEKYYKKYIEPDIGITAVCLPSTSPANAVFSTERLKEFWGVIR